MVPLTHLKIQRILQKTSIIDYLAKKGHEPVRAHSGGRFVYLCPLPGHSETKPSFYVWTFSEYENFYCFGCFPEDAEVCLSDFSSCKITDLKLGQEVAGGDGQNGKIVRKLVRNFAGRITRLKSKKVFCDLVSTWDHEIYVLPYINKRKRRPHFSGQKYGHNVYKYGEIVKEKSDKVRIGDCLCIPITQGLSRLSSLNMNEWTDKYHNVKGPHQKSFGSVKLTDDLLYLFGIYIAEGSSSDRVIRFSLNAKEISVAERIKTTLKKCFSLNSSYFVPKNRNNSLEITCCSSFLSKVFKEWFGDSCDTKKLPLFLFRLSNKQSKHLIDGYFDGDGYQKTATQKVCETVSKQWSRQLFDMLNRLQLYPSLNMVERKERKVVYSVSWTNPNSSPGKVGIYRSGYYCVPVISKSTSEQTLRVFNLTVTPQHSYIVNLFAVGNCQSKYNIIHLISHMENISSRDVIQKLAEGFDLSSADEVKLVQETWEKGIAPPDRAEDLAAHLLHISAICNEFLKSVEYEKSEYSKVNELWKLVDINLIDYNIENIENISEHISDIVGKRLEKFIELEKIKLVEKYTSEDNE